MTTPAGPGSLRAAFHAVWAPRLHVGLFLADDEPIAAATLRAARYKAERAGFVAGDTLLDVGCGFGADTALLAEDRGCRVVACDLEPWRLRQTLAPPGVPLLQADHQFLPFADRSFSGLWACETLGYATDPSASLTELARVAAPGARAVLQEPFVGEGRDPLAAMRVTATRQLMPLAVWRTLFEASWILLHLENWSSAALRSYRAVATALERLGHPTAAVAEARRNMAERQAMIAAGDLGCFFALLQRRA